MATRSYPDVQIEFDGWNRHWIRNIKDGAGRSITGKDVQIEFLAKTERLVPSAEHPLPAFDYEYKDIFRVPHCLHPEHGDIGTALMIEQVEPWDGSVILRPLQPIHGVRFFNAVDEHQSWEVLK